MLIKVVRIIQRKFCQLKVSFIWRVHFGGHLLSYRSTLASLWQVEGSFLLRSAAPATAPLAWDPELQNEVAIPVT